MNSNDKIAEALFGGDENIDTRDPIIAEAQLAGDAFELDGQERKKTEFISAYDVSRGITVKRVNEIRAFAEKFNRNTYIWGKRNPVVIDDALFGGISKAVMGEYGAKKGKLPDDILVESVFILELKKYMEKG